MATALYFANPNILLLILNAIFIGIIVYISVNRFTYIINTIVYAIAKSVIPIITSIIFSKILGVTVDIGFWQIIGNIFILIIPYFILGLLVVKIAEKMADWFDYDSILLFIIVFTIVESISSLIFLSILRVFV